MCIKKRINPLEIYGPLQDFNVVRASKQKYNFESKKISLSMANSKHQTRQISSLFSLFLSVYVFPFSLVLPSRSASSCCHSSFSYSLVSSSFLPCFSLSPILRPSFFPCFLLPSLNSSFLSLLPCVFPSFICVSSSTANVT